MASITVISLRNNEGFLCPNCQQSCPIGVMVCPSCNTAIVNATKTDKIQLSTMKRENIVHNQLDLAQEGGLQLEIDDIVFLMPTGETVVMGRHNGKSTGQNPDMDLSMFGPDKGVSRLHARIQWAGFLPQVCDLGSTNGTFLNGRRLITGIDRFLQNGDVLSLGNLKIKVRLG